MTRRSDWYWRVALFLSSVALAAVASAFAIRTSQAADQKWCSIITTLDDSWKEQPPTQPSGKNVAAGIADLRREYHCP